MSIIFIGLGSTLVAYSTTSIVASLIKCKELYSAKLPFIKDDLTMSKEKNLKSVELFGREKSVFFSDPPLFFGSSGKCDNLRFTDYRNISNSKSITYICNITKDKCDELLKNYDQNNNLKQLIESNADKELYLHEIVKDSVVIIDDKKNGFYHQSQKFIAMHYAFYTRFPLTFTSGIIGLIILSIY